MASDLLIVDDSAPIREILQQVLRKTGLAIGNIYEAGDGQAALALLETTKVDLILSDVSMPGMDGLELLAALKASARWRRIPVITITTERTKASEAGRLGAVGHIRKPFSVDQIKETLAGFIDPAV